jgi:hypothetical protein
VSAIRQQRDVLPDASSEASKSTQPWRCPFCHAEYDRLATEEPLQEQCSMKSLTLRPLHFEHLISCVCHSTTKPWLDLCRDEDVLPDASSEASKSTQPWRCPFCHAEYDSRMRQQELQDISGSFKLALGFSNRPSLLNSRTSKSQLRSQQIYAALAMPLLSRRVRPIGYGRIPHWSSPSSRSPFDRLSQSMHHCKNSAP